MAPQRIPHYSEPDGTAKIPAAWLIEQSGLVKGTRRGAVGLSSGHTLSLVCHQGATARALLEFACEIRATVAEKFGLRLLPGPVLRGFSELGGGLPRNWAGAGRPGEPTRAI